MKITLAVIIALVVSSCQNPSKNTKEVPELSVSSALNLNLKSDKLVTGWYYISEEQTEFERDLDKSNESYFIDPKPIATQSDFQKVQVYTTDFKNQDDNYTGLTIQLGGDAIQRWSDATKKSVFKRLGLILNDKLIHAPKVNSKITNGMTAINRTEYSTEDIEKFEKELIE